MSTTEIRKHSSGLYSKLCNLNLDEIKSSCLQIEEMIRNHIKSDPRFDFDQRIADTGKVYEQYNFLMYPLPGVHHLYREIRQFFHECYQLEESNSSPQGNFYIQCWLNVYHQGDYIDWHEHAIPEAMNVWHGHRPWHGFFCVNAEPSTTSYRFKNQVGQIEVESKNNLLVMGRTGEDMHRTHPWTNPTAPRITIAFDIIPDVTILRLRENKPLTEIIAERPYFKNHWIPI